MEKAELAPLNDERTRDENPADDIERWVESARAYVPSVARRFISCGLPFDELMAAGNLGLVQAALRFDPSRRIKFVTYADWWIRKSILKAIQDQSGPVRLPRYRIEQLREIQDSRALLKDRLGREPEIAELAEATGRAIRDLDSLLRLGQRGVSIDHSSSTHDPVPLGERLADEAGASPQHELIERDDRRFLRELMGRLEERERSVLELRYGLRRERSMTLRQVGSVMGISRERVRQIERRALERLRSGLDRELSARP